MDKGAHFFRCDFQVHTPRDANWKGKGAVSESDRKAYAEELVLACRKKGLGAIAITDHHDFAFFPYIKRAAAEERDDSGKPIPAAQRLTVFPGIELTLSAPTCQALLILDADFPENLLESLLTALAIAPANVTEAKHANVERIPQTVVNNLSDLYDKLNVYPHFRDRFTVFPNVGDGGLGTMLRAGFADYYKNMPCVGGYVDGSVAKLGAGNRQILEGKNRDYGFKRVAVVQTSDNRQRDHSSLGTHTTWVKWSKPTAEALRQACLAEESRLSHGDPTLPSFWISSITVSASKFLGKLDLDFNQQYNALIGGRGTGKSTILEYVRWGLCDEPADDTDWDLVPVQARRRKLVGDTLEAVGAEVVVTFFLNDVPHVVKRNAKAGTLQLRIGDAAFEAATEDEIRGLLPIQAYSQKQLSNVGVRVEELRRFVELPVRLELDRLRSELNDTQAKIRVAHSGVVRKRALETEIAKDKVEAASLGERIEKLRLSLKGLSKADEETIQQKALYDNEEAVVERLGNRLEQIEELVNTLQSDVEEQSGDSEDEDAFANRTLIKAIRAKYERKFDQVDKQVADLARLFDAAALKEIDDEVKKWKKAKEAFDKRYEAAKAKAKSNQQQLTQIATIEKRLGEINKAQVKNRNALAGLSDPDAKYAQLRSVWGEIHLRVLALLKTQCQEFSSLSGGLIRAEIERSIDTPSVKAELKTALAGLNVRDPKLEAVCDLVAKSTKPTETWKTVVDELEMLVVQGGEGALPDTPLLQKAGFGENEKARIASGLEAQKWLDLSVAELPFSPVFSYRTSQKKDEFIPFGDASAGQQATALLTVLLSQDGAPLIIDQPEDDVDSKMTSEIVQRIWSAKAKRQLIFASHSANVVVNGDAELVICCDYTKVGDQTGGRIKAVGAIDIAEIREEITAVTEGGKEAFKLRKAKYGF